MKKSNIEKVRYTITFPPKSRKILEKYAEEEEITKADVIRRSLCLYIQIKRKLKECKGKLLIENEKGEKTEVIFV